MANHRVNKEARLDASWCSALIKVSAANKRNASGSSGENNQQATEGIP